MKLRLVISLLSIVFAGCTSVTLPIQEYALARSAFESALHNDAERLAPVIFQQAQQVYKYAERLYEDREYEDARLQFIRARKYAEKAESLSRLKKSKTGEVL